MNKKDVFFFIIFSLVLEILKLKENISDDVIMQWLQCGGKSQNQEYLWKYSGIVTETWHQQCTSRKTHIDGYDVAMAMA